MVANTQDLQYHYSPARTWFLALVDRTLKEQVSTRSGSKLSGKTLKDKDLDLNRQMTQTCDPQGMYICGPDGTPYGFTNDHDPPDISKFMDRCLFDYQTRPPKRVVVSPEEKAAAWSVTPPATAQVLQVLARIPNVPKGCSFLNEGIGRDFCWLYAEEAAALVKRAQAKPGGFALPETFARRIARFHLVDDVRGTPDMWAANEVRALSITARTLEQSAAQLLIHFEGKFSLSNGGSKRGYTGALSGYLKVDPQTNQIARFRTFVDGKAWGVGTFTPNSPPGRYRMVIAMVDTKDPAARFVPPEEVATYNRDTRYRNP